MADTNRATAIAEAIMDVMDAFLEAIKAGGKQGVPSGHLYAMAMYAMTLEQYQSMIRIMVKSGKVIQRGDLLYAKGVIPA